MPCCARRVVSVAPTIENAKPDEMPRNSAASGARSRYGCTPSDWIVIVDRERRMVGEATTLVDRLAHCGCPHTPGCHLVIDAPADVLGVGLASVRPPCVVAGLCIQAPKDIDEA